MFNSDSLPEDVNAVVRKVNDKESAEKKIKGTEGEAEEKDPREPEKEDEPFNFLDVLKLVEACVISQTEYNFKTACVCEECLPKIELLTNFEKEIKIKRRINENHSSKVGEIKHMCSINIYLAADETKRMLYILHKELGQLNEDKKSGVPMTPEGSRSTIGVCDEIFKLLEDNDFYPKDEKYSFQEICDQIDKCDLSDIIFAAKCFYKRTKVKSTAIPLLEQMEIIEKKKLEKEKLDLTDHLNDQVELARRLPILTLQRELEAAIDKICPFDTHTRNYLGARDCIDETLEGMIWESVEFWKRFEKCPSQGHSSNGLDKTLDKLIEKAESFEEEWDSNYASFFKKPFNDSDHKKQRIE